MKSVDLILKNAIVVTMDASYNLYEPGAVAITGDKITAVGPEDKILGAYESQSIVNCQRKVLMPGLINAHTHVPMTLLRGLSDDLRLDVWLMGYMMPVEREFVSSEFVYLGTQIACAEMIRGGTTTFADMYYFEDDVAEAAAQAGMRAVCGESILKFPSPDSPSWEDAIEYTRNFIKKWKDHPLIIPAVAPHAPYTNTPETIQAAVNLAVEYDVPLHTHISETSGEVEDMRRENGMPVVPWVKKQNLFDAKVIAAHCVHIDEGEMRTMKHLNASAIHNPSSNMKLASGMAPIQKMLDVGMNVGLGTDGTASNNDLDMFEEMRLANFMAKVKTSDPTTLPAKTTLALATRFGAKALHIDHLTGSLTPGKRADMILIDLSPLHNSPRFKRDPDGVYAQIIYAAKSTDVTDTMVNGKWLMRDQRLLTLEPNALVTQSLAYAEKIDAFLLERENSVLSKLIAIGGATEEESYEVQAKVRIRNVNSVIETLDKPEFEILYKRHYREYDTYLLFDDPEQGRIRFREDNFLDDNNQITQQRMRLTHIGQRSERGFGQEVMLSRSRFLAPAQYSLRFYNEYFKPNSQQELQKDRLRFLIKYNDIEFYINIDTVEKPELGSFLEVKSRTWSRKDAEKKSKLVLDLISVLGADPNETVSQDYIEMIEGKI
jgi:5-methylthioadenosine/S-adenosylhomocysteine deaminase